MKFAILIFFLLLLPPIIIQGMSMLTDFMENERKAEIHELAREVVKRTTDRVVKQVIDERDTTKAVEAYNTKRKEMLAQMFPSVYNTNTEHKKEYE